MQEYKSLTVTIRATLVNTQTDTLHPLYYILLAQPAELKIALWGCGLETHM